MRAAILVASLALAACYDPTYRDLACGPAGACPDGFSCVADVCVRDAVEDVDAAIDAPEQEIDAPEQEIDAPEVLPCADGQVQSPSDPSRCFFFLAEASSWTALSQRCEEQGAVLADIRTAEENDAVVPLIIDTEGTWLGGSDEQLEGIWMWIGGELIAFERWAAGQPDDGGLLGEDCLQIAGAFSGQEVGTWLDAICDGAYPALCVVNR